MYQLKKELSHLMIKKIVKNIENKAELAEYLSVNPTQVSRWYSGGENKRSVPEKYRKEIIEYIKNKVKVKKEENKQYKKRLKEYAELSK